MQSPKTDETYASSFSTFFRNRMVWSFSLGLMSLGHPPSAWFMPWLKYSALSVLIWKTKTRRPSGWKRASSELLQCIYTMGEKEMGSKNWPRPEFVKESRKEKRCQLVRPGSSLAIEYGCLVLIVMWLLKLFSDDSFFVPLMIDSLARQSRRGVYY